MIHIHRWTRWKVVSVRMTGDRGHHWREDTQQRTCTGCGRIKVRRP